MLIPPTTTPETRTALLKRLRYPLFAIRFVVGWACSMVVLFGFALLANIEWARPQIEGQLSQTFHRQVRLGRLSWTLGLNGISVNTDRLVMKDVDGGPCIKSEASEIGIAFLPLFHGIVLINHLKFSHPEIWATWQKSDRWNITDLFLDGPEVKYLQLDRARIHLTRMPEARYTGKPMKIATGYDIKLDNWKSYDLEDVDVKLISTRRKNQWPFYLSFKYKRPQASTYTTVRLDVTGQGHFKDWQKHKYQTELKIGHLNPLDLQAFVPTMATVDGDCDVQVTTNGVYQSGLNAVVTSSLNNIIVIGNGTGNANVVMPAMKASAQLTASPKLFHWDNTSIESSELQVQSSGDVLDWQQSNSRYKADVNARLSNVESFGSTAVASLLRNSRIPTAGPVPSKGSAPAPKTVQPDIYSMISERHLTLAQIPAPGTTPTVVAAGGGSGDSSAVVELKLSGNNQEQHIVTTVKAERVALRKMVGAEADSPLGAVLSMNPTSDIRGDIEIGPDNRINLKKVEIPVQGSSIHANGTFDPATKQSHFSFKGENLTLTEEYTRKLFSTESGQQQLSLSGRLDLSGEVDIKQRQKLIKVRTHLLDARISSTGDKTLASKLSGGLDYDGSSIVFANISGVLAAAGQDEAGNIKLSGRLGHIGPCDFTMTGTHVDMEKVLSLFRALSLKYPETLSEFRGKARDFYLSVRGTEKNPIINLSISPEAMTYHGNALPPEVARAVRFNSGGVCFKNDELTLTDLGIVSPSGKYTVSCLVTSFSKKPHTDWIKIKSNGVDFHQVHTYLSSEYAPEDIRKPYNEFLTRNGLASVHGNLYGDLYLKMVGNEPQLEGVFGFFNAGGTVFNVPFNHGTGVVAASKNELLLQDLQGVVGHTALSISGNMTDYQKRNARWMVEVRGQLQPQDIESALGFLYKQQKIEVSSTAPLNMRATAAGAIDAFTAIFNCKADETNQLRIKTKLGTIHQPKKVPLTIDGSMTFNTAGESGQVKLNNCHIISGQSILQGNGKYEWSGEKSKAPTFDLILTTPNQVPASTMIAVIDPSIKTEGIKGTARGTLALAGTAGQLLSHGDVSVHDLSIPEMNLLNINGRVDSPRWSIFRPESLRKGKLKSEATIWLETGVFGGIKARDLHARIIVQDGSKPRLVLKDGIASISGGKVKIEGWYEPDSTKWHSEMVLDDLQVQQFCTDLMEHSSEITGLADARITLESQGPTAAAYVENLSGRGKFHMHSGTLQKFGKLQEKLTQANFLHQGLFGFNLNNLLQSVLPVRTGRFKSIDGTFNIADGIVAMDKLLFDGNDIRLRAAGKWNMPLNTISMEVAGNLPRVASSIIPGAVGTVSKNFTMQKAFGVLTFRKLQNLPSIPLLGDIASDNPRAFMFTAKGPVNSSTTISHSIEKSFKWLANKPGASAHPVPGI